MQDAHNCHKKSTIIAEPFFQAVRSTIHNRRDTTWDYRPAACYQQETPPSSLPSLGCLLFLLPCLRKHDLRTSLHRQTFRKTVEKLCKNSYNILMHIPFSPLLREQKSTFTRELYKSKHQERLKSHTTPLKATTQTPIIYFTYAHAREPAGKLLHLPLQRLLTWPKKHSPLPPASNHLRHLEKMPQQKPNPAIINRTNRSKRSPETEHTVFFHLKTRAGNKHTPSSPISHLNLPLPQQAGKNKKSAFFRIEERRSYSGNIDTKQRRT